MHKFIALISTLLAFAGCDPFGRSIVMREYDNGQTLIDSRVNVRDQIASFHCVASQSSQCHYALFQHDCNANNCNDAPFQQFAIPAGSKHDITGLPSGFLLCVSQQDAPMTSSCLHPRPASDAIANATPS